MSDDKLQALRQLPNVIGYNKKVQKRIKDGQMVDEEVIQVFVSQKVPDAQLTLEQRIPDEIDGIPTDVVDLGGEPKPELVSRDSIRSKVIEATTGVASATEATASMISNRMRHRPIVPGISIGNINITAGTYGWVYDFAGKLVGGTNAHVGHELPAKPTPPLLNYILQPGSIDGGGLDDTIGYYRWHDQIVPETPLPPPPKPCNIWCQTWRKLFGYKAPAPEPIPPTVPTPMNKQDFLVFDFDERIEYELNKTLDFEILDEDRFVGLIFAGTPLVSLVTKVRYQLEKGYYPLNTKVAEIKQFDKLFKSGRTTGFTGKPPNGLYTLSDSVVMKINYGSFYGWYDDIAMVNKMSEGGDSGSPVFKRVE